MSTRRAQSRTHHTRSEGFKSQLLLPTPCTKGGSHSLSTGTCYHCLVPAEGSHKESFWALPSQLLKMNRWLHTETYPKAGPSAAAEPEHKPQGKHTCPYCTKGLKPPKFSQQAKINTPDFAPHLASNHPQALTQYNEAGPRNT